MSNCFYPSDILLPDFGKTDAGRWAVIACDQFTSEPEYWESVKKFIDGKPSTLDLILPEAWLNETSERVPAINAKMREYLNTTLVNHPSSMIYLERTQASGGIRRGIIGMIDLECYDYNKGADSLVRATEGTVLERIPPRVAIRRGAALELPHVMLLIDDPDKTVIEPLIGAGLDTAYDFDLMEGGGHVTGRFLDTAQIERVNAALCALTDPDTLNKKYGFTPSSPLLFAVGDGNHSLASAKAFYEEVKASIGAEAAKAHPARYALCEVVNLHDEALGFEPIYRVVFGADENELISGLKEYAASLDGNAAKQSVRILTKTATEDLTIARPEAQLTVGTLQNFLDRYVKAHPGVTVDYIHGEDSVEKLVASKNAVGFIFEGMGKDMLFKTVMLDGALPRKTFSMGHARDKRYYLEARRIVD